MITLILFSFPIFAAPLSPKNYKFMKELKYSNSSNQDSSEPGIVSLILDEEVYKNSYYGDLRILADDKPIPYIRKDVKIKNRGEEKFEIKQIFKKRENESTIFVLELPKLPKDHIYTYLEVDPNRSYEEELQVSTGSKPDSLNYATTTTLYSYGEEQNNKIIIGPTKHRFVRIVAPKASELSFTYVTREKIQSNAFWSTEVTEFTQETSDNTSTYSIPNPTRSPFSILKLKFKEGKFERDIKIEEFKNEKNWETVFEGMVDANADENSDVYLSLNQMISSTYRITINNGDNPPIHLEKITQTQIKEELVFLAPTEQFSSIKLYYGNRYAREPQFDSYFLPNETDSPNLSISMENQTPNPDFGYSIIEPPVSGYIANGIFYLGFVALLGISFSFYKKVKTEVTP